MSHEPPKAAPPAKTVRLLRMMEEEESLDDWDTFAGALGALKSPNGEDLWLKPVESAFYFAKKVDPLKILC